MSDAPEQISDMANVVRGGRATGARLMRGSDDHPDGPFGFSVQSEVDQSVDILARAGRLPHRDVGVTTAGEIRRLGFDVVRTSGRGFHATVVVPRSWTEAEADSLAELFVLQPNPTRR